VSAYRNGCPFVTDRTLDLLASRNNIGHAGDRIPGLYSANAMLSYSANRSEVVYWPIAGLKDAVGLGCSVFCNTRELVTRLYHNLGHAYPGGM
jgi:hypothetical protein